MGWRAADQGEREDLCAFLKRGEWGHVAFSARIREQHDPFDRSSGLTVYVNRPEGSPTVISESMLLTDGGLLVPVLSNGFSGSRRREGIATLLRGRARFLHSVIGLRDDVLQIEHAVESAPYRSIDYFLMTLDDIRLLRPQDAVDVTLRRARPRHVSSLFPLQSAYEKEEVLLDPSRFNSQASYRLLVRSLRKDIVYYAANRQGIVAKAGTNAIGFQYAQLGGVFTVPAWRGQGVASALMELLVKELDRIGLRACLFVKQDNPAAVRLYTKLGFTARTLFRISYYGR